MYVCVCVCACVYMYIYTCMYVCLSVCMYVCISIYLCIHIYIYIYMMELVRKAADVRSSVEVENGRACQKRLRIVSSTLILNKRSGFLLRHRDKQQNSHLCKLSRLSCCSLCCVCYRVSCFLRSDCHTCIRIRFTNSLAKLSCLSCASWGAPVLEPQQLCKCDAH